LPKFKLMRNVDKEKLLNMLLKSKQFFEKFFKNLTNNNVNFDTNIQFEKTFGLFLDFCKNKGLVFAREETEETRKIDDNQIKDFENFLENLNQLTLITDKISNFF
jgi:hypothetical protein